MVITEKRISVQEKCTMDADQAKLAVVYTRGHQPLGYGLALVCDLLGTGPRTAEDEQRVSE